MAEEGSTLKVNTGGPSPPDGAVGNKRRSGSFTFRQNLSPARDSPGTGGSNSSSPMVSRVR